MDDINAFLKDSPIAARTRLPVSVVLQRTSLSSAALLEIKERGVYDPDAIDTRDCELEVGGQVLARGKIVKRRAHSYLKITEVLFDESAKAGGAK